MYETEGSGTQQKTSFTESLASVPGSIDRSLPSMDKRLGKYIDAHMSPIISEWGLVTRFTLDSLEHRLDAVSADITALEKEKLALKERASAFEQALSEAEEK
ncbi:hypothetical protein L1S32_05735 [Methanogenium sp. S4BF]|uniref:hypothetical protein n=1 Tax=Methanogenium sp. S4BF TaxID=1789226 RepID=UPI002416465E|nr:hypothetical protein [Methanogenium sp. S4BF]WFN35602.1 hypothetical protein L1S32_05735 [Methanogenium sp. S4BF]